MKDSDPTVPFSGETVAAGSKSLGSGPTGSRHLKPWETLRTRELLVAEPWIKLSVQQVRLPNGIVVDDYHKIELSDYAVVFAETVDGKLVLERLYKHGIGEVTLVLPAGAIEQGERPLDAAQRELLEETGFEASHWQSLGTFTANGNYGCGKAHLFKAESAKQVSVPDSGDLEEMEIILLTRTQVMAAVQSGRIASLGSVATIAIATNPLMG